MAEPPIRPIPIPIPQTMQALQLTSAPKLPSSPIIAQPPILNLTTLPVPVPQPGEILVKIHASPILPSDLINVSGRFPYTTYPRIPGRDWAGVIVSAPGNEGIVGKSVYGTSGNTLSFTANGAQAQYLLLPSPEAFAEIPQGISYIEASMIGVPFSTAALCIKAVEVKMGETVLVLGANGSVGNACVQLLTSTGAKVIKGIRNPTGEGEVSTSTTSTPLLSPLDDLTDGKGVDVVIDTIGSPSLTTAAITKLAKRGRLVFIASPRSPATTEKLELDMLSFYRNELKVVGINSLLYSVEESCALLQGLKRGFEDGSLTVGLGSDNVEDVKLGDGVGGYEKAKMKKGGKKMVLVMC